MATNDLSPEQGAQLALEELAAQDIPDDRLEEALRAIMRMLCERGEYSIVGAILRRRLPELVVYDHLMALAREIGHDEAAAFELVWGNFE